MIPTKKEPKVNFTTRLPKELLEGCRDKGIHLPALFEHAMRRALEELTKKKIKSA